GLRSGRLGRRRGAVFALGLGGRGGREQRQEGARQDRGLGPHCGSPLDRGLRSSVVRRVRPRRGRPPRRPPEPAAVGHFSTISKWTITRGSTFSAPSMSFGGLTLYSVMTISWLPCTFSVPSGPGVTIAPIVSGRVVPAIVSSPCSVASASPLAWTSIS